MIESLVRKQLALYSGTSHPTLAEEVAEHLGTKLGDVDIHRFPNGEMYVRFLDSVRGTDAFVIQSPHEPLNEQIMELFVMLDALKRASSSRVIAIIPSYPYARKDKKELAREPISGKLIADLIHTAGADRVLSIDLHAGQIQGFFDFPFDHLTAFPLLIKHIAQEMGTDITVVAPDAGRVKVADKFARKLDAGLAIVHKRRDPLVHGVSEVLDVVGEVAGRRCLLVDDMIDTAGTIAGASEALVAHGATEVWAAAVHPVLSGPAVQRLTESPIAKVVVTNSVPIPDAKKFDKLVVLSVAPIIADAIKAIFEDESVSGIFGGESSV